MSLNPDDTLPCTSLPPSRTTGDEVPVGIPRGSRLAVSHWFNTTANPTLADLRGEVVVIEAFQMLCPGCLSQGLPQAMRIQQVFGDALTVLGLHRVFEHHEAMTPISLEAFLYEYRITFPVGVDAHDRRSRIPINTGRYQLRGPRVWW